MPVSARRRVRAIDWNARHDRRSKCIVVLARDVPALESLDDDIDPIRLVQDNVRQHLSLVILREEAVEVLERLSMVADDATVEVSGRELLSGLRRVVRVGRQHLRPPEAPLAARQS